MVQVDLTSLNNFRLKNPQKNLAILSKMDFTKAWGKILIHVLVRD